VFRDERPEVVVEPGHLLLHQFDRLPGGGGGGAGFLLVVIRLLRFFLTSSATWNDAR
jgi:hypothetical protein